MTSINPVTPATHSDKSWRETTNFSFASGDTICPIAFQELPKAILGVPVGFVSHQGKYVLAAIQGLSQGSNLFVNSDGAWQGRYIPAIYRCYPFLFASNTKGENILCIDTDSGQILDSDEGERFFESEGKLSAKTQTILDSLAQIKGGRQAADAICQLLLELDLIEPWPIEVEGAEGPRKVFGLFRISESRLNKLSAISLKKLLDKGALSAAYCQLLSMNHIGGLQYLANAAAVVPAGSSELDFGELSDSGSINFDNL